MFGFAPISAGELSIPEIIEKYGVSLATAYCLVNIYNCNSDPNSSPDWKAYEDAKSFFKGLNLGPIEYENTMRCVTDRLNI